jgi:predicted AlkP superfamily phosphohydrolase/phosphomutase
LSGNCEDAESGGGQDSTIVKKILVIGLDSAPLELIEPWVKEGRLPALGQLMTRGASGVLRSTIPPLSPAAWSSFATGMNPGKHGVFDHAYRRPGTYEIVPTNARRRAGKTLWELVGEQGGVVGVVNVPETYPPEPVNGFLITGMSTPTEEAGFCYPPTLAQELEHAMGGYRVFGPRSKEDLDRALAGMRDTAVMRLRAAAHLMHGYDPQLMIVVLQETDAAQHRFWKYMDPDHPQYDLEGARRYGNAILEVYQHIDDNLHLLLKQMDEDGVVIVMSDHGGGAVHKWLYLNNWLVRQGLIHFKPAPLTRLKLALYRMGLTPGNILEQAMRLRLGLTDRAVKRIRQSGSSKNPLYRLFLSFGDVDWTHTRAYTLGGNMTGIYINLRGREPEGCVEPGTEYEALRDDIIARLADLRDQETGVQVATRVYRREELYAGPGVERAPDVIFETHDERYVGFGGQEFTGNVVMAPSPLFNGCHRRDGMVVLAGKPIRAGERLGQNDIVDIAPTILYLLGYKVPANMDGHVLVDALTDDFLAENPVRVAAEAWKAADDETGFSQREEEIVTKRLRGLGYL